MNSLCIEENEDIQQYKTLSNKKEVETNHKENKHLNSKKMIKGKYAALEKIINQLDLKLKEKEEKEEKWR